VECLGFEMGQGVMLLTLSTFLHIFCTIALDGHPEVFGPEDSVGKFGQ